MSNNNGIHLKGFRPS